MPTLASPVPSTLGVLIAVHELGGQPDAGLRPLLVSHATGFHGRCYLPMAHELADRFHSIGFDYRGHGDTPRPEGPVVRFKVHPLQRSTMVTVVAEAPLLEERWITSSNGHRALRPVILTHVSLGGESWPIEVTLTARDEMGFRMLLGRQALRRRFLVDAGRSDLAERGIVVPKLVSTRAKAPRTKEPSA